MNRAPSNSASQATPKVRSSYRADEQRHAAETGRGAVVLKHEEGPPGGGPSFPVMLE